MVVNILPTDTPLFHYFLSGKNIILCFLKGIFYVCLIWFFTFQSSFFQLCRDRSSWVEPVLSKVKGHNAVMPVRLKPAIPQSQVKHSTTDEPLCSQKLISHYKGISFITTGYTGDTLLYTGDMFHNTTHYTGDVFITQIHCTRDNWVYL